MDRRTFLMRTGAAAGAAVLAPEFWRQAFVDAATPGPGPYGALGTPDANGLRLPAGFTSRIIATSGQTVAGTSYTWHLNPDGGQCFPRPGGGWLYVNNSEVGSRRGGVSAISFDASGAVVGAYRILSGTSRNCSGGITPWRTYLSCEETSVPLGHVYECDPYRPDNGVLRPGLGAFNHEAAVIDPVTGYVYLTEDETNGRLYRFVPARRGDLSDGQLFAASLDGTTVTWIPTSSTAQDRQPTTTPFNGGEGMYVGDGAVYFTTKGDKKVWELTPRTNRLIVLHDASGAAASNLNAVDAIVVHHPSGDLYVAEDGGNMEVGVIGLVGGVRQVASILRIDGHAGSEVTGLAFSPDGTRLYFNSQRGSDGINGVTYEITGPFRAAPTRWAVDRDAYVRGGSLAGAYGTKTELQVCANSSAEFTKISYLSVDTTGFEPTVARALLRLNARSTAPGASDIRVHAVRTAWTEAGLSWAARPPLGRELGRFTVLDTTARWYETDLSAYVAAERAMGRSRISVALVQDSPGDAVVIRSREATANTPHLALTPLSFPPVQAVSIPAARDAHVRAGISSDRNYGTSPLLEVAADPDPAVVRWSYLVIDTDTFVRDVASALFRVQARSTGAVPEIIDVYSTATNWADDTITWDTRPSLGTRLVSFTVQSTAMRNYTVNLTSHVQARRAAGQTAIGLVLRARSTSPLIEVTSIDAGANPPRLILS